VRWMMSAMFREIAPCATFRSWRVWTASQSERNHFRQVRRGGGFFIECRYSARDGPCTASVTTTKRGGIDRRETLRMRARLNRLRFEVEILLLRSERIVQEFVPKDLNTSEWLVRNVADIVVVRRVELRAASAELRSSSDARWMLTEHPSKLRGSFKYFRDRDTFSTVSYHTKTWQDPCFDEPIRVGFNRINSRRNAMKYFLYRN
jgi:hypothetical protein